MPPFAISSTNLTARAPFDDAKSLGEALLTPTRIYVRSCLAAIRDSVRALFVRECTPARVREAWSNEDGRVPGLWAKLAPLVFTSNWMVTICCWRRQDHLLMRS